MTQLSSQPTTEARAEARAGMMLVETQLCPKYGKFVLPHLCGCLGSLATVTRDMVSNYQNLDWEGRGNKKIDQLVNSEDGE